MQFVEVSYWDPVNITSLKLRRVVVALGLMLCSCAHGQTVVKVLRPIWQSLSEAERATIQQAFVVDVRNESAYGIVIDNQGVDISTAGTTDGAALGSAVANATYVDRAFNTSSNYSAKTQLAVGILGAVIGSSFNKPAVQQYHYRYALKLHDGEISYQESIQSNPFRHPVGMCLELKNLSPVPQILCTQTAADVRKDYIKGGSAELITLAPLNSQDMSRSLQVPVVTQPIMGKVDCKLGNLAPILITPEKCNAIGGTPI